MSKGSKRSKSFGFGLFNPFTPSRYESLNNLYAWHLWFTLQREREKNKAREKMDNEYYNLAKIRRLSMV